MFNSNDVRVNHPDERVVRAVVIGAGTFGGGIVAQSAFVSARQVVAVADSNPDMAFEALERTGVKRENIVLCASEGEAIAAQAKGQHIVARDARLLFGLAIDVVVEATGVPEFGALHAKLAIEQNKNVAMVTKEADACVGPMPKHLADQAGAVYTAVDGDQHGLLIGLVRWARSIGLEVLCGGKALDSELVLHAGPDRLTHWSATLGLSASELREFAGNTDDLRCSAIARRNALGAVGGAKPWDVVELTIAANATGLLPDRPALHGFALRTTEISAALCPAEMGGLLAGPGRIEAVQLVRRRDEVPLQGGVFIVVAVRDEQSRRLLIAHDAKGHPVGQTALIFWPHHLLGIEAIHSILQAARHRAATGAHQYSQSFDVVYRTARLLPAGFVVGDDHSDAITAEMRPARPIGPDHPLPAALTRGNRLTQDVPAGTLLTGSMVNRPDQSVLWSLRDQQDALMSALKE